MESPLSFKIFSNHPFMSGSVIAQISYVLTKISDRDFYGEGESYFSFPPSLLGGVTGVITKMIAISIWGTTPGFDIVLTTAIIGYLKAKREYYYKSGQHVPHSWKLLSFLFSIPGGEPQP